MYYGRNCARPSQPKRLLRRSRQGFTLIELVVVVAIISIVAAVAVFMLPDVQGERDIMAAHELAAHLRYVHSMAMNRERTTRVVFTVASNSYSLSIADTNAPEGYVPVKDPVTQEDWVVFIADRFSGVELSAVDINGNNVLYFNETNGVPCDISTNTPLAGTATVTFLSGRSVTITPLTGYVRIE